MKKLIRVFKRYFGINSVSIEEYNSIKIQNEYREKLVAGLV